MRIDQIAPEQVAAMTDAERRDLLMKTIEDYNALASAAEDLIDVAHEADTHAFYDAVSALADKVNYR